MSIGQCTLPLPRLCRTAHSLQGMPVENITAKAGGDLPPVQVHANSRPFWKWPRWQAVPGLHGKLCLTCLDGSDKGNSVPTVGRFPTVGGGYLKRTNPESLNSYAHTDCACAFCSALQWPESGVFSLFFTIIAARVSFWFP